MKQVIILGVLLLSAVSRANFADVNEEVQSFCYGRSMIGYDNVINATLGTPIENMLRHLDPSDTMTFDIVRSAYEWAARRPQGADLHYHAHDFARRAFQHCIELQNQKN